MTEREKFEQWASMPPREWNTNRLSSGFTRGEYGVFWVQYAWEAWQAAIEASTHKAIYEDEV